jgi:hypothetical protein
MHVRIEGDLMAKRLPASKLIARAREIAEKCGTGQVHPNSYTPMLPRSEEDAWNDLLGKIK